MHKGAVFLGYPAMFFNFLQCGGVFLKKNKDYEILQIKRSKARDTRAISESGLPRYDKQRDKKFTKKG